MVPRAGVRHVKSLRICASKGCALWRPIFEANQPLAQVMYAQAAIELVAMCLRPHRFNRQTNPVR